MVLSLLRKGSGFPLTLIIPISFDWKFRREVDFPLPLSPKIKTGMAILLNHHRILSPHNCGEFDIFFGFDCISDCG